MKMQDLVRKLMLHMELTARYYAADSDVSDSMAFLESVREIQELAKELDEERKVVWRRACG